MGDKSLYDLVHTELAAPRLRAELPYKDLIIPVMGTLENLVDLVDSLGRLEALFNHVR